eukprot:SAG11_NODE_3109_length_2681_cov_3.164214_4_plen_155_part_00
MLQRLTTGSQDLRDDHVLDSSSRSLQCLLHLLGGKGGFGAMLRSARGGLDAKKTTNFEACRDLNGRRMRHVNNEKQVKEWVEAQKEKEAQKKTAAQEPRVPKYVFDDTSYSKNAEAVREAMSGGVAVGMKMAKQKAQAQVHRLPATKIRPFRQS